MEEKKFDVKELAKSNIFIQNSKAIKFISDSHISDSHNVDIGVALDMFCTEHNMKYGTKEYREFLEVAREITLNTMVEELD